MARLDAYANAVKRGKARGVAPKEKPRVLDAKNILAVKRRIGPVSVARGYSSVPAGWILRQRMVSDVAYNTL